jgi:enamine deaminase RidA (YjgF/YER057c/UK114 family)
MNDEKPWLQPIQPLGWPRPKGYSNGILVPAAGRMLFIAGMVGWDEHEVIATGFTAQFRQALANVLAVLQQAGGQPQHIARMTIYVADCDAYNAELRAVGDVYRELMGRWFPAMALVQVARLLEVGAMLEIEATAVLPPLA